MATVIFHIDVNSAYLSWTAVEQKKQGAETDLRDIPSIIGGNQQSRHGVVLAKSIPAQKYGIHTGEPVVNAFRKCPNLVMEPPNQRMYEEYSCRLMEFLYTYTPDIEQVSVDECFLDFTGISHRYRSPVEAAFEIKNAVYEKFGFTVNIGISSIKLLAKMASDLKKPNKVHTLFPEEIQVKMWPLPLSELYMAGRSSVETLHKMEIRTIGALAQSDPEILKSHLKSHGQTLWEFANGIDSSQVEAANTGVKGIGNSTTLSEDVTTVGEAKKVLLSLSLSVGRRLREATQKANMVSVEIKYYTFKKLSHQKQLLRPSSSDDIIYKTACELFEELWDGEPIRLLGIRTSKLTDASEPEQMSLFDMPLCGQETEAVKQSDLERHKKVEAAMDEIKKKYGEGAVVRGTFLKGQ